MARYAGSGTERGKFVGDSITVHRWLRSGSGPVPIDRCSSGADAENQFQVPPNECHVLVGEARSPGRTNSRR